MDKIPLKNQLLKSIIMKSFKRLLKKFKIKGKILEKFNYQTILKKWMIWKQKRWFNNTKSLPKKSGREAEIKEYQTGDSLVRKSLSLVLKRVMDQ